MGVFDDIIYNTTNIDKPGTIYSDGHSSLSDEEKDKKREERMNKYLENTHIQPADYNSLGSPDTYSNVGLQFGSNLLNAQQEGELNNVLADAQSNWQKTRNALARTVVSELALGSIKGFSDLADFFIGGALRLATGEDNDYTNPISKLLEDCQTAFEEYTPIYSKDGASLTNSDWGWWMSNMPSIMSSLTLMIPAKGVGMAASKLSKLAKATKLGKRASVTGRRFLSNAVGGARNYQKLGEGAQYFAEGMLMRIGENYQESRQTYNEMLPEAQKVLDGMSQAEYEKWLAEHEGVIGEDLKGMSREDAAKRVASMSADETFKDDMVNAVFDIAQLYGVGRMTRFMNAPHRGKIDRLHKLQKKYPGKTTAELEEMLNARSRTKKILNGMTDLAKGTGFITLEEASEGVEEAVNYIAQQEGLNYGDALLNKAMTDKNKSDLKPSIVPFNRITSRAISDYAVAPELWDSAFWGVVGGVTFGSAMPKVQNYRNRIAAKKEAERLREKGIDENRIKEITDAMIDPEYDRRAKNINRRAVLYNDFLAREKDIKEKYLNPFDGTTIDKNDAEEMEQVRKRNLEHFETQLMLAGLDAGHWNLSKDFLNSEPLGKQLVEAGYITEEELNNRKQHINDLAEKVEKIYNDNMDIIDNAISTLMDEGLDVADVPVEYFDIIARKNVTNRLSADRIQEEIDKLNGDINRINSNNETKGAIAALGFAPETLIRTQVRAQALGQLIAERNELENSEEAKTIAGQQMIDVYNRKIDIIRNQLSENLSTSEDYARYIDAMRTANSSETTEVEGKPALKVNQEKFDKIDEAILNNDFDTLFEQGIITDAMYKQLSTASETFVDNMKSQFSILDANYDLLYKEPSKLGRTAITRLQDISKKLYDDYHERAVKEIQLALTNDNILNKASDIMVELDHYNNEMQETIRYAMTEAALERIMPIAEQHGATTLINEIQNALDGKKNKAFYDSLSEDMQKVFNDVVQLLDKTKVVNTHLKDRFFRALTKADIKSVMNQNSTTNQNPTQSTQNNQQNNTPQTVQNAATTPQMGQNGTNSTQVAPTQTTEPTSTNPILSTEPIAETIVIKEPETTPANNYKANITLNNLNDDGTTDFTVDFVGHDEETDTSLDVTEFSNGDLEVNLEGTQLTEDNKDLITGTNEIKDDLSSYIITKNPVLRKNEKGAYDIVEEGEVKKAEDIDNEILSNSSTGEVTETTASPESSDTSAATTGNNEDITDAVMPRVSKEIMKYIKLNDTYNTKEVADYIRSLFTDVNQEELEKALSDLVPHFASLAEQIGKTVENVNETTEQGAINAAIAFSELNDSGIDSETTRLINSTVNDLINKLVNNYAKKHALRITNGKYVLSKENVLRYFKEVSENNNIDSLYDNVKRILNDNSDKYIVIDENDNKNVTLNHVNTDINERQKEYISGFGNATSIGVAHYLNNLYYAKKNLSYARSIGFGTNEETDELVRSRVQYAIDNVEKAIDTIKVGDRLEYKHQEGHNQNGLNFYHNGTKIGETPKPRITEDGNYYVMNNRGWITDIPTDIKSAKEGNSKFATFIKNLIIPKDEKYAKLKKLLEEGKNAEFISEIQKDSELKELLSSNITDAKYTAEHINDLINYGYIGANMMNITSEEEANIIACDFINRWVEKLNSSYSLIDSLYNSEQEIEVDSVPKTSPITSDGYTSISQALSDTAKQESKIGFVNTDNSRIATLSDGTEIPLSSRISKNSPILYLKEGDFSAVIFVKLQALNDVNKNSEEIKNIISVINTEINNALTNWSTGIGTIDEVFNVLSSIINPKQNSILRPTRETSAFVTLNDGRNGKFIQLNIGDTQVFINDRTKNIYSVKNNGKPKNLTKSGYNLNNITSAIVNQFNNLAINLQTLVNNKNIPIGNSIISIDNIAEFVINSDAITVNTSTANGTNFVKDTENSKITYRIVKETSPVEDITTTSTTKLRTPNSISKQVTDILKKEVDVFGVTRAVRNAKTNLSKQILDIILKDRTNDSGASLLKILNRSGIINKFLNKNVIFVENLNDLYIKRKEDDKIVLVKVPDTAKAAYNEKEITLYNEDGSVAMTIAADSITVGPAFIEKLNGDLIQQEQAARDIFHENVHSVLAKTDIDWKGAVKEVISDLGKALNNDTTLTEEDKYVINSYLAQVDEEKDRTLEEFFIESITRPELMKILGRIEATNVGETTTKESLLQKILKLIAKLFDVKINNNSLLQKEYNLLKEIADNTVTETKTKTEPKTEPKNETDTGTETETKTEQEQENNQQKTEEEPIILDDSSLDFSTIDDIGFSYNAIKENATYNTKEWLDKATNNGLLNIKC